MKKSLSVLAVGILFSLGASATNINLTYNPNDFLGTQGQKALAGFQEASDFWASQFTDQINVNLNIGFSSLADNILGSTSSNDAIYYYSEVAQAMAGDAKSANDISAASSLVCGNQGSNNCAISFLDQEGPIDTPAQKASSSVLDADGSVDNIALLLSQANAKALGFVADTFGNAFSASDASIIFNTKINFDFDRTDGISNDAYDFVGVAIHEIGHALGFSSGVDTYDYVNNGPGNGSDNLDDFVVASALDLFRYSNDSLAVGPNVLDFRPYVNSFFSIDGGNTNLANFSQGQFGGDGYQASHFALAEGSLLSPTLSRGYRNDIDALDLVAFDVIGWDLAQQVNVENPTDVPEPSTLLLFGTAFAGMAFRKRLLKY